MTQNIRFETPRLWTTASFFLKGTICDVFSMDRKKVVYFELLL